jgi:hypothetical protein
LIICRSRLFHLPSQEKKEAVSPVIPIQVPWKQIKSQSKDGDSDTESISLLTHSAPATQKKRINPSSSFFTPHKVVSPEKNDKTGGVTLSKQGRPMKLIRTGSTCRGQCVAKWTFE